MRHPPEAKRATRDKLVRESGALAKKSGFAASGVDALARAAGLTSGAFYKHFAGKDALLAAICESELSATRAKFEAVEALRVEGLLRVIDVYLSPGHAQHPAAGCMLPSLTPEVARAERPTRDVFERELTALHTLLADKVGDADRARALIALCVGAVSVARALASDSARADVLKSAREAARQLLSAPSRAG